MSLINEALKRARKEAARQDQARRQAPPDLRPLPPRGPRSRRMPFWAAVLLVALAGVAALLLARMLVDVSLRPAKERLATRAADRDAAPGEVPSRAVAEPEPEPGAGDDPSAAAAGDIAAATPEISGQPAAVRRPGPQAPPVARGSRGERAPVSSPEVEPSTRREPEDVMLLMTEEAGTGTGAAPATEPEASSRSYRGLVELSDGRRIELGGIAWSETGPFALINGRVMGPGESVEGWVIERIEPKQVELKGPGGTLYLTLR